MKNCSAYTSFDSFKLDHRIVSCRCQISYRQNSLLYGAETRTINNELEERLDGMNTSKLMWAQNLSSKNHPTKDEIYGELPPISTTVAQRRARFTGHCFRAKDQVLSDPLLWRLPCPRRGKRPLTYPDTSSRDRVNLPR